MSKGIAKNGLVASLLSLLIPGLGQIYNAQLIKGFLFLASIAVLFILSATVGLLHSFTGLLIHGALVWSINLAAAIDALIVGVRHARTHSIPKRGWLLYLLAVVFISVTLVAYGTDVIPDKLPGVRAYKLPSNSMAPTIIAGDRFMTDLRAFEHRPPSRGEVVLLKSPVDGALVIKRVIAEGGDIIQGGPKGTIVNDRPIPEPYVQATHVANSQGSGNSPQFGPLLIPPNQFFVMGDNRNDSFDSRYPQFGLVAASRIVGKPSFIYWSWDKSRIGRTIR
jgi:signal peptidase I